MSRGLEWVRFQRQLAQRRPCLLRKLQRRPMTLITRQPLRQVRLRLVTQRARVQTHRPFGGRLRNDLLLGALAIHV